MYCMWGSGNESWKTGERANYRIPAIAIAIMPPHCISRIHTAVVASVCILAALHTLQEYGILPHSCTYYCLLFSLYHMFIIFVISYQARMDIRIMLEHYHMSFLLTTENGNFHLYPIMFTNQILYKADGLHSDVQNLELQGFYDSFLIHCKYPYPRLQDLRL